VEGRLKASQVEHPSLLSIHTYSTNFTFEFIRRPISPILSPSSRTFIELTPRHHSSLCIHGGIHIYETNNMKLHLKQI
jgi:hypothetical protein